jgi:hypothetical protein
VNVGINLFLKLVAAETTVAAKAFGTTSSRASLSMSKIGSRLG